MTGLFRAVNRRISACKNGAFHFNYSMKQGKIYFRSPIKIEIVHLNDNLRDILGFNKTKSMVEALEASVGLIVIFFTDYPPAFSSDNCIHIPMEPGAKHCKLCPRGI